MAHYAYISNSEFTETERARLYDVVQEINSICQTNKETEEYQNLDNSLESKYTSDTLETLKSEILQIEKLSDEYIAKESEIQAEEEKLEKERLDIMNQMQVVEYKDTDDLVTEKQTLETTISNALCRVTEVIVGKDEIYYVDGDSSEIDAEIKALEESKKDYIYNPVTEERPEELINIDSEIQNKLEQKKNIPKIEVDNTVYLEAVYGGVKRTSYNGKIRKNFAGKGMIYDPVRDAFYGEQPYESWTLDEDTCVWKAPVEKPSDDKSYIWNEETQKWIENGSN